MRQQRVSYIVAGLSGFPGMMSLFYTVITAIENRKQVFLFGCYVLILKKSSTLVVLLL